MLNTDTNKFNFNPKKNIFPYLARVADTYKVYLQSLYVHSYLYMVQSFDGYPAGS
jgi:hypothetical protein